MCRALDCPIPPSLAEDRGDKEVEKEEGVEWLVPELLKGIMEGEEEGQISEAIRAIELVAAAQPITYGHIPHDCPWPKALSDQSSEVCLVLVVVLVQLAGRDAAKARVQRRDRASGGRGGGGREGGGQAKTTGGREGHAPEGGTGEGAHESSSHCSGRGAPAHPRRRTGARGGSHRHLGTCAVRKSRTHHCGLDFFKPGCPDHLVPLCGGVSCRSAT